MDNAQRDRAWIKAGVIISFFGVLPGYWDMHNVLRAGMDLKSYISLILPVIGSGFLFGTAYMAFRKRPADPAHPLPDPDDTLKLLDTIPERTDHPGITYKSKLRIVLANKLTSEIVVFCPEWIADVDQVSAQLPQISTTLQLEGERGWKANHWNPVESARIRVPPGGTFRLWVGLDQGFSEYDLKRRMMGNDVGTIAVPIKTVAGFVEYRKKI